MAAAMAAISRRSRCSVHVDGQPGGRVARGRRPAGRRACRRSRRAGRPARPARTDCSRPSATSSSAEPAVLQQPDEQAGVDAAAPGGHDQALQRGEAHGGVDAAAARAPRPATRPAPRWQVTMRRPAGSRLEQLGGAPGGVRVRQAVEAEPAQAEALRPGGRAARTWRRRPAARRGTRCRSRRRRARRGSAAGARLDAGQRPRLVQRRQVGQVADRRRGRRRR